MSYGIETLSKDNFSLSKKTYKHYAARQPALYRWAEQFNSAVKNDFLNPDIWDAFGRGLVVIGPDKNDLREFLMISVGEVDGRFLHLDLHNFLECAETLSNETLPTIVLLAPDDWLYRGASEKDYEPLRTGLVDGLRSFARKHSPIVVVTYAESYGSTAECFRYRGIFDRHIHWAMPKPLLLAEDFIEQVGPAFLSSDVLQQRERLGRLLSIEFPSVRRLEMFLASVRRKATFESRPLTWQDLMQFCINGTGEGGNYKAHVNFDNLAVHEAGHAVAYIVSENFVTVPDIVTIISGDCALGASVDSYDRTYEIQNGNQTFSDACKKIRVLLAGRAAEELSFGLEGCSAFGSQNDLESASSIAIQLIMQNGFPENWEDDRSSGSNLFSVPDGSELGESKFYDFQLRAFLDRLYTQTKEILVLNKELFDCICDALKAKKILMREDVEDLLRRLKQERVCKVA